MASKTKIFGTDGVRGKANSWPITPDIMLRLALASGMIFKNGHRQPSVVIGKDTRLSGYMIESALTSGYVSLGLDVMLLGPIPTPAVGMMTRSLRADLGVMISASHNPHHDNGIKFFGPDGYKLSDAQELEIKRLVSKNNLELAEPNSIGKARRMDDATGRYIEYVKYSFPRGKKLNNLKIVVDCANGAAYKVAPAILWELGAELITIANEPNGLNINDCCGAMDTRALSAAVIEHKADLGIALDGDADRLIIVDENGDQIDGDYLMALIASSWLLTDRLKGNGVVATQMSNLGLERYLSSKKLKLHRTKVGDRYVVKSMLDGGFNVGGEQSGHIILSDYSTTGDGLIAALQVLNVLQNYDKPASSIRELFEHVPQVLKNIEVAAKSVLRDKNVRNAIKSAGAKLGKAGRLLVRPSGTESKIRVMAEGDDSGLINSIVDDVIEAISSADNSSLK